MDVLCVVELPESARERIARLGSDVTLSLVGRDTPDFQTLLPRAEVLAGWFEPDDLRRAVKMRWLQLGSAGADRFIGTVPSDVILTTASGVFGPAIAEHVLGMMLVLVRGIGRALATAARGTWDHGQGDGLVRGSLHERTLAVIGLGDIGRALAVRAKAFGMQVLAVRRRPGGTPPPDVDEVHGVDALDSVVARADHVVLALPATPDTDHLMDARRLALMKSGAFLYNVGRGNAIDEAALIDALRSGAIGGAGLDVFAEEPLPAESPLWKLDNVVITPHTAGYTGAYAERFAEVFADNLERYVRGVPLNNLVDRERGY